MVTNYKHRVSSPHYTPHFIPTVSRDWTKRQGKENNITWKKTYTNASSQRSRRPKSSFLSMAYVHQWSYRFIGLSQKLFVIIISPYFATQNRNKPTQKHKSCTNCYPIYDLPSLFGAYINFYGYDIFKMQSLITDTHINGHFHGYKNWQNLGEFAGIIYQYRHMFRGKEWFGTILANLIEFLKRIGTQM